MAVCMYKEGNTHTIKGVTCEVVRIDPEAVQNHLALGYKLNVNDLYKIEEEENTPEIKLPQLPEAEIVEEVKPVSKESKKIKAKKEVKEFTPWGKKE